MYALYVCSIFHYLQQLAELAQWVGISVYRRVDDKIYLTLANTDAVACIGRYMKFPKI